MKWLSCRRSFRKASTGGRSWELAHLTRRPAILVYTQSANFHLWAEVLDAGGYDVVEEPFTRKTLREAVLRAAWSFDQQREMGIDEDLPDQE